MSLLSTKVQYESKRPITVEPSRLLPDGRTWSRIGIRGLAWNLALTPEEARDLVNNLISALEEPHG